MQIPREIINRIRDRADIESVVRRYVPSLTKKGKDFIGLCPFHKEKTPSFTVSVEKRIFYCFGCHAGGNVFSFISRIEGLSFPQSVRFVGDLVGIPVTDSANGASASPEDAYLKLNSVALGVFYNTLREPIGKPGLEYVLGRGVSREAIDEFKLGFAPESWNHLTGFLKGNRANLEQCAEIGLVSKADKEGRIHYYDKFRNRLIFPICNASGEPIAFGGRIIGPGEPKYLNSPESAVFQKRGVLYGFNRARDAIRELKRAIVVEGYLDVIGCHQQGVRNVVAPLGTALTQQHVDLLARYCNEIILVFDADPAGINASLRSIDVISAKNVEVRVAALPESDPFEFVRTRGIREFMAAVDSALSPVDYRMRRVMAEALPGAANRTRTMVQLFEVIRELPYESERSAYVKRISALLSLDENAVRVDFKKFLGRSEAPFAPSAGGRAERADFETKSYRDLVALLCAHPRLVAKAVFDFSAEEIVDPAARSVFARLLDLYSADEEIYVDKIFDFFSEGDEKRFLEENVAARSPVENPDDAYTEIYINLKLHQIDRKINRCADTIRRSGGADSADVRACLTEIEVLRREKEKLSLYVYNRR